MNTEAHETEIIQAKVHVTEAVEAETQGAEETADVVVLQDMTEL